MKKFGLLVSVVIAVLPSAVLGYVRSYAVEPRQANWSGKVSGDPQYGGIAQSIVCNFDGLEGCFAEYFTGTATNQSYQVQLKSPGENGFVVADGDTQITGDHKWIRCYFKNIVPESIIKGRTYDV